MRSQSANVDEMPRKRIKKVILKRLKDGSLEPIEETRTTVARDGTKSVYVDQKPSQKQQRSHSLGELSLQTISAGSISL